VANLPPVTPTPAAKMPPAHQYQRHDTSGKFAAGVINTGGKIRKQYQAAESLK
jgi:hypothetical protein